LLLIEALKVQEDGLGKGRIVNILPANGLNREPSFGTGGFLKKAGWQWELKGREVA